MVYSRETAAVISNSSTNTTTYDAQFARLTCFAEKQGKATMRLRTKAEKGTGQLRAGVQVLVKDTVLGKAVTDVTDSE